MEGVLLHCVALRLWVFQFRAKRTSAYPLQPRKPDWDSVCIFSSDYKTLPRFALILGESHQKLMQEKHSEHSRVTVGSSVLSAVTIIDTVHSSFFCSLASLSAESSMAWS